jgi:hypothetical protein
VIDQEYGCHRLAYSQTCVFVFGWRKQLAQVSEYRDLWHPFEIYRVAYHARTCRRFIAMMTAAM